MRSLFSGHIDQVHSGSFGRAAWSVDRFEQTASKGLDGSRLQVQTMNDVRIELFDDIAVGIRDFLTR